MTEMQFGSGAASSSTHRLTQTSSTLNRRYVERPSNLAIEEAARDCATHPSVAAAPSRLVNLRVHAADLEKAQQAEPVASEPVVPKVIELGGTTTDLSQIVPEEAPLDESISYLPTLYGQEPSSTAPNTYVANQTNYYSESTYDSANNYTDNNYTTTLPASASPVDTTDTQALAMNIAADYAAANLGASLNNTNSSTASTSDSIDSIASAASEAIAAIRTASDPSEIADQVISLQTFANNLKSNSTTAEMLELSDTIEKFVKVAMKSSRVKEEIEKRSVPKTALTEDNIKPQNTTKKPTVRKPAAKVTRKAPIAAKRTATPHMAARKVSRPVAKTTRVAAKSTARRTPKVSSTIGVDEEQALRKALRSVTNIEEDSTSKTSKKRTARRKGSGKRFALAFFCAIICVGAIVYFVGSSIPDISVKVAAMQTGIEASYPSYVPREFSLSDINSENGKITMTFTGPDKASFSLSEEKSSWDSSTLLRNFVEPNWNTSYITTHEQGITIYISGANAAWVNGGVLYKIEANGNSLTKKQLRNIVVSL